MLMDRWFCCTKVFHSACCWVTSMGVVRFGLELEVPLEEVSMSCDGLEMSSEGAVLPTTREGMARIALPS